MKTETVVGLFKSSDEAQSVASELMDRGFSPDAIHVAAHGSANDPLSARGKRRGETEEIAGGRPGETVVSVEIDGEVAAKEAVDILYKHDAMGIDRLG